MLLTYNELNPDLGYVQGMSDLLAPIYAVMQDDAVAFWGFVCFMNRMVKAKIVTIRAFILTLLPRSETFSETSQACALSSSLSTTLCNLWILSYTSISSRPTAPIFSFSFECCLSGINASLVGRIFYVFGRRYGPIIYPVTSTCLLHWLFWKNIETLLWITSSILTRS
jgi:Rab-GTPase-TBC domain-containing protein